MMTSKLTCKNCPLAQHKIGLAYFCQLHLDYVKASDLASPNCLAAIQKRR